MHGAQNSGVSTRVQQSIGDPHSRNWTWRAVQLLCQLLFLVWFRFRSFHKERLDQLEGALLLINHQSYLDPMLVSVSLTRPVSFLARDSLFPIPFIGWILKNTYVMPVNRQSASSASIRECVRRIENGYFVGLFPEGTRTENGEMGEVKPGFISIARRIQHPIVPIGVAGAFDAYSRKAKFIWPATIRVVYGIPISYQDYAIYLEKGKEEEFTEFVQRKILECQLEADSHR